MKNLITGHFPSASNADPDIFYFNFNTRVGRVYENGEPVNYNAWIANEGIFPYVDSNGNGQLDIRDPNYYTLEDAGYTGGNTYTRPAYNGQATTNINLPGIINPGPSLFNNSGQAITFIAEWNGIIVRFNGTISNFTKGSTVLLNDGDTVIYDIEKDTDGDGVRDAYDAFPNDPTETTDADNDGVGANTDVDDNDPLRASGTDSDGDGTDDEFDTNPNDGPLGDEDGDGVVNSQDLFSTNPNRASGIDDDGDLIDNEFDNDPNDGPLADADNDGTQNKDDAFPNDPNEDTDSDGDGTGDNADTDDDNDGIPDTEDVDHPSNAGKPDTDGDGTIDDFDTDDDNDGIPDTDDTAPTDPSVSGDTDGDGVDNLIDSYPNDPNKASDTDTDGDGVDDLIDSDPTNPNKASDTDTDGDGVDDLLDSSPNDGSVSGRDSDKDGTDDAVDTDMDNDGYSNDVDSDPTNPYVFTGDGDGDGIDSTIDPDDADSNIGIFIPTVDNPLPVVFMNYDYGNVYGTYADYYRKNVAMTLPPEAQGCLYARTTMTTGGTSGLASDIEFINARLEPYPSTWTDRAGNTGDRHDYDPYPTITGKSIPTFFRVSVPKGTNGWSSAYNFEFNINPVPYFSPNGQMFSLPFEWAGYYPLYITAAEANERSPSNSSHAHTFTWNEGTHNGGYPAWNSKTINTTKTFYMPNGLTAADANTPERQYLTHYWHGNHPGLPVWSVVSAAGAETGSYGFYAVNNGKAFEWTGPQNGAGVNLCTNTATYGGVRENMIFPPAIKSDSLTTIKSGIPVTVS